MRISFYIHIFNKKLKYIFKKIRENRANIGLTRKTEPDDSQPDPDRPVDFEPDPGARSPKNKLARSNSGRPGPNANPWLKVSKFFSKPNLCMPCIICTEELHKSNAKLLVPEQNKPFLSGSLHIEKFYPKTIGIYKS